MMLSESIARYVSFKRGAGLEFSSDQIGVGIEWL